MLPGRASITSIGADEFERRGQNFEDTFAAARRLPVLRRTMTPRLPLTMEPNTAPDPSPLPAGEVGGVACEAAVVSEAGGMRLHLSRRASTGHRAVCPRVPRECPEIARD